MGQDEEPAPAVSRASFSRREQSCLWRVAQAAKACRDVGVSHGQVSFDVFAPDPFGLTFVDDTGNFRPKVTRVGFAASTPGVAEGLAGIAGRDEMNAATPCCSVEGS